MGGTIIDKSASVDGPGTLQINGSYTDENGGMNNTIAPGKGNIVVGSNTNANATLVLGPTAVGGLGLNRAIENWGTILKVQNNLFVTADIDNQRGALIDIQGDALITGPVIAPTLSNRGTVQKSAGKGTATISIFYKSVGGTLLQKVGTIDAKREVKEQGNAIIAEPGTVIAMDQGFEQDFGTLTATAASIAVSGDYALDGGLATIASSILATTTFELAGGTEVVTPGYSTIDGATTNSGTIAVGGTSGFGITSMGGPYWQSSGALNLGIGGTTAGAQFDQLNVTGAAHLGGTLNVSLVGFTPSAGNTFEILALPDGYSGTFAAANLPAAFGPGNIYDFQLVYDPYDVTLKVVTASTSAPTVTALTTNSGTTAGGTSTTITGTNFSDATAVTFWGVPALSYTINRATSITAVSPADAAGTVNIQVTNPIGTSATSSADDFTYTAASGPSVTGLGTTSGYETNETPVTINGTYLAGATAVLFGSVPAPFFQVQSSTQILAYAPVSTTAGTVHVTVTTPTGTSSTSSSDQFTYDAVAVPTVSAVSPGVVGTGGGDILTLTGTGFTNAQVVLVGGGAANIVSISSDTSMSVSVPPQAAGSYDVTVGSSAGFSSLSSADRVNYVAVAAPSVTSLGTSSGTTAGGTVVAINGSGFTGASDVLFGSVPAASFVVDSDSLITAVSPPEASGHYDITVDTPSGTSAVSSSDQFTVSNASTPTVSGLSVTSGTTAGGAVTTISGSYFTGATGVNFGTVPAADFTVLADGSIVATAPAEASGTVDVTVTTYSGTSSTGSSDHFTVSNASTPTVSALSVSSGPDTGGTPLVITGSYFTGATAVNFGGTSTDDFTVLSDNAILVYTPADADGSTNVTVTTYAGTSSSYGSYTFNSVSAPAITSLSTSSGSTTGGTLIEIAGSGFTGAEEVDFGSAPVFDFTVNSDSQITVYSPTNYAGTFDVQVTTAAGTSAPVSADQFTYSAASAPSISSLGTSSGSTTGGTSVAISGSNFTAAVEVLFGGVPATSFTVNSSSSITAVSPPGSAGTVDIQVETTVGSSAVSSSDQFTYSAASAPTVISLGTSSGVTAGGTLVAINGTNFTSATGVTFGGVAAESFTVFSVYPDRRRLPGPCHGHRRCRGDHGRRHLGDRLGRPLHLQQRLAPGCHPAQHEQRQHCGRRHHCRDRQQFLGGHGCDLRQPGRDQLQPHLGQRPHRRGPAPGGRHGGHQGDHVPGDLVRREGRPLHLHQRDRLGADRDGGQPGHGEHGRRAGAKPDRHRLHRRDRGQVREHQRHGVYHPVGHGHHGDGARGVGRHGGH